MCDMEAAPEEIPEQLDQCKALHAYYHAAVCDACDLNIMGTRWKCLQCPDYDLCAVCERKAHERHPAHHVFIELPRPLPESGWHVAFPLPELFDAHSVKERAQVHVGCFCIRCKNPIHGARWVCVNCIDMYQLCAKCHDLGPDDSPTSAGRHFNARNHVFAKLRFAPDRQTPRFHSLTSAGMSFDANSSSADEDVDVHVGLEVDPMLFVTPLSNDELVASGRVVLPHVHSTVPGDLEFPLLPVPWTGANAIDDARVQSQLARSSELRRSLSESNGHPKKSRRDAHDVELKLRPMVADDVGNVMVVEHESFSSPYEARAFTTMLRRPNCFLFVCEVLEKTHPCSTFAGYVAVRVMDEWLDIVSLAVSSKCRGMGVGRALLMQGIDTGRMYHCTDCRLNVSVFNVAAQGLYKSCGFVPTKWLLNYYASDGEDALEMTLQFYYAD